MVGLDREPTQEELKEIRRSLSQLPGNVRKAATEALGGPLQFYTHLSSESPQALKEQVKALRTAKGKPTDTGQ